MSENRIPLLIISNAQKLIKQLVPSISQISDRIGIKNLGQSNMQLPGSCLPQSELQEILILKNNLTNTLNSISKTIDLLSKPINTLTPVVNALSTTLNTVDKARIASNVALAAIPLAPGAIPAGINIAKDTVEFLNPKIQTFKNQINSISEALNYANNIIFKILTLLKIIDQYLLQCGIQPSTLTPINDIVDKINQQYTEAQTQSQNTDSQVYQGFILEIIEEPFSSTVNRKKAVAKNSSNIILLQTPPSFTSSPQILIQQLKLIIDNSDLKAN
jgi:hypothetical protein